MAEGAPADGEPLRLIRPPATVPSETPDPKTEKEQSSYDRAEKLVQLTPLGRHLASNEELLAKLREDCDHHRGDCDVLRRQLDDLRPKYAALSESHRSTTWHTIFSTVATGIGAILVGAPHHICVYLNCTEGALAAFGWGVLVLGFAALIVAQCIGRNWKSPT